MTKLNKSNWDDYKTDIFTLKLPEDWAVEITNYLYNLYNKNCKGVLQITTYRDNKEKEIRLDLDKDIRRFVNGMGMKNPKVEEVYDKVYNTVKTSFILKNKYWMIFLIASRSKVALITYHCKNNDRDYYEISVVRNIIDSFMFLDNRKITKLNKKGRWFKRN